MSPTEDTGTGTIADGDLLSQLLEVADRVFIKKLSNNDRDWASNPNKHQSGPYIPMEPLVREFFPPLERMEREDAEAAPILETLFETVWPQINESPRISRLVNYTSKGAETHMTRVPKALFKSLLPASFLVVARIGEPKSRTYQCMTVDSDSQEAALLRDVFDIGLDFVAGVFEPRTVQDAQRDELWLFFKAALEAWNKGRFSDFVLEHGRVPSTAELALEARRRFLKERHRKSLNPFASDTPGDDLREISRKIEWDIFREAQRKERSLQLVRLVLGDKKRDISASDIIQQLIFDFPKIDALLLSASQQRKSRAGRSYEHHIAAMLKSGKVPFQMQAVLDATKRADFVLPSLRFIKSERDSASSGLILSAKTTLRERWKQVLQEMGQHRLFLTTLDENVPGSTIEDMASFNAYLVIPESLRVSKQTEYEGHANVLTFKTFCEQFIGPRLDTWAGKP